MTGELGLQTYLQWIEPRLADLLPEESEAPVPLAQAMRYSVLSPGKRLRPALAMACAEASGGDPLRALDPGCAVEIVHCFSLIHDDLPAIDNDDLRRGRPTCHKVYGEAVAILAGDALFALAFQILGASDAGLDGVLELARATGFHGVVGGETMDVLAENQEITPDELRTIHQKKTGALFACACAVGALSVGSSSVGLLREYGQQLGLAFQIVDDILNETSSAEQLGKAAGSDRDRQKATYPALFGLDRSRELAGETIDRALACLEPLPGPTEVLKNLAYFALQRSK